MVLFVFWYFGNEINSTCIFLKIWKTLPILTRQGANFTLPIEYHLERLIDLLNTLSDKNVSQLLILRRKFINFVQNGQLV